MTTSPLWFSTSAKLCTTPCSGFERERRASVTVTRTLSTSPGRTGLTQRNSSMPGEARLDAGDRKCAAKSRIIIAAVCHPLAISPPK